MFIENVRETLNEDFNKSVTENGALGYRTTGKELLDLNFLASSLRKASNEEIVSRFAKTFYENKVLALKWLFFARDVRKGLGERRLFKVCFNYLVLKHQDIAKAIIPLVAEYGRHDDLFACINTDLEEDVINLIKAQLMRDIKNMNEGKPVSLLVKWLPSSNATSEETRKLAVTIRKGLGMSERRYRKTLARLRAYLKVTETQMSANKWDEIDYQAVPSKANALYKDAFLRHDKERRLEYLEKLQKGEAKINAGAIFPHDIVHKYDAADYEDITLEEMWKALPDYVKGAGNTICVSDGSGSMDNELMNTSVTALDVANALSIYFAERCLGEFKDKYITFSENPQLVDLSKGVSLKEKIEIARLHDEVADTNIEAVFDLILQTAVNHNMTQEELPQNILILSDMEFNHCACTNGNNDEGLPTKKTL